MPIIKNKKQKELEDKQIVANSDVKASDRKKRSQEIIQARERAKAQAGPDATRKTRRAAGQAAKEGLSPSASLTQIRSDEADLAAVQASQDALRRKQLINKKAQETAEEQGTAKGSFIKDTNIQDLLEEARIRQPPESFELDEVLEPFTRTSNLRGPLGVPIPTAETFSDQVRSSVILARTLGGGLKGLITGGDPFTDSKKQDVDELLSDLEKYKEGIEQDAPISEIEIRQLQFNIAVGINQLEETTKGLATSNIGFLRDKGTQQQIELANAIREFGRINALIDNAFERRNTKLGGGTAIAGG